MDPPHLEPDTPPVVAPSRKGGRRPGAGRPPALPKARRLMRQLGTKRLDQRSTLAVLCRDFKLAVAADLGGDLTKAQEALLERAAVLLVLAGIAEDRMLTDPHLVTKRKGFAPIVAQYHSLVHQLVNVLGKLGLHREAADVTSLEALTAKVMGGATPAAGKDGGD